MPGSLQILVSSFFVFGDLGCLIFFMMVSVCKARLLKNVNKHFHNFISQKRKWDEKLICQLILKRGVVTMEGQQISVEI